MIPEAAKGFALGLAAGTACLAHCAAVLGPALAVNREGTIRASLLGIAEFSAGRAAAYLGAGLALGWASARAAPDGMGRLLALLTVPLGLLLIVHLLREDESPSWICRAVAGRRRWVRTPLLLGLASGFAPCAPFALAAVAVFESARGSAAGRALHGALFFSAFFLGTSVFLLPLAVAGLAPRFAPVRRAARGVALLVAFVFVFTGLRAFLHPPASPAAGREPVTVEQGDLRAVFPDADAFSSSMTDAGFPYRWALRRRSAPGGPETSRKIGVCFLSTDAAPGIPGWAGEIPVLVGLTVEGRLAGIRVLPGANRETPGFVDPLYDEDFARPYRGRPAGSPFEAGADVDAVTGATVSVEAVNRGVREGSRRACRELLGIEPPAAKTAAGGSPLLARWTGPALLLVLVAAAAAGWAARAGFATRAVVLGASALLLGAWQGLYVTSATLARGLSSAPPPGPSAAAWWVLVAAAAASGLLLGKLWCGWVCPFGAVQELLYRAVPGRLVLSERWDRRLRWTRTAFLAGFPLLAAAANDFGILRFEPLSTFFRPRSLTAASAVLLAVTLLAAAFVERFHCKFLCPVGALSDLLARERVLNRKPGLVCGGCFRGERGCRYLREQGDDFQARKERLRGDCIC